MREFKFRIWNLKHEYWCIDSDFYYHNLQQKKGLEIIQQFTGLLDKNNKEIYEGDLVKVWKEHEAWILKSIFCDKKISLDYTCGEIVWLCESFKVCQKNIGATYLNEFATCGCCPCALEKIGNIFENPSLIIK